MTDWNEVMRGCGGARPDDNDMVQITRGTARLARAALKAQNETDYYHNFGAAERELITALGEPGYPPEWVPKWVVLDPLDSDSAGG
jgi:hypothetical protein